MDFAAFADRAAAIEGESADTAIVAGVEELLAAAGADLPIVARFVQGRTFPAWDGRKLDVGPSTLHAAIARAAGRNVASEDVEAALAEHGEIGAVAESFDLGGQTGLAAFAAGADDARTVRDVYDDLAALAATEGAGSEDTKVDVLFSLFNDADPTEARYLARLVLSEMRIGVGEGTVRDGIAAAFDVPVDEVERALQVSNDYGRVARIAREEGRGGLAAVTLTVGRPVQAMLAQAGTVTGALADWDAAAVETKYDGARVQVHHHPDGLPHLDDATGESPPTTKLYSRNVEDVTDALPEIVDFVETHVDAPAVVDGEVVAVDDDGAPLPFQNVLRRFRRKHDVAKAREDVALSLHAFDCLHADGRDLLDAPFTERHDALAALLGGTDAVSEVVVTDDPDEIEAVESAALSAGHEGIMLKAPDSAYSPGKRGRNWRKRKPDVETLDCVIVGAEWGEGRRATLLGTFECAVRTGEGYETVGNVATGITDEELAALTERLEPHVTNESGQSVAIAPEVVIEVGYEAIQTSPTYGSGYALRFPRFVGVREDKDPADADTLSRVERLADSSADR